MSERYGKVRWGILATGGIAATFTEALLSMPDAEVTAVGSRSEEAAKEFAERYGIGRAYGSWAELAADDEVDVVYVATPHSAHRAAAELCLEAGKAVLCEKAFTLNQREARELVDLARSRGLFLMEAMWTYCNPLIRHMVALVAEGAIGEVRNVSAHFGFPGEFAPTHRLRDPDQGGGALLDLGVYPVSFAQLFLGEPDHVAAWAHLTPERVDDNTAIALGWNSGAVASLSCSFTTDTGAPALVAGSAGRIEIPDGFFHADRFVLHRPGHEPHTVHLADVSPSDTDRSSMRHEAAEVMRCLREGRTESPLLPLDGSLSVMRTLDTIRTRIGVTYPGVD
ncbi:Gfo/Idh/MocA family protein [Actinacidiphila acididurans]|uniref:Gfo/Idh/MocA family oxidoreductase n=1 Tax=Actinacidiphila acididurans TaxID=2784346 RepID=A0ABS2TX25_9ACTN|nr:Gfo/Idh/MocA family oxidoreductase [Actinacidiphila acididurans]MBM9507902.1 Gfo/Idh/MocA family oxidoreductase [Actinacidiphila acididurans]